MKAVGLDEPLFAQRGEGAYLEDVDGRRYVDWVLSWGPLIFGHADPETVEAVIEAARDGTTFGTATEREVELAEEIAGAVPSVEMVRLVSSGTEIPRGIAPPLRRERRAARLRRGDHRLPRGPRRRAGALRRAARPDGARQDRRRRAAARGGRRARRADGAARAGGRRLSGGHA